MKNFVERHPYLSMVALALAYVVVGRMDMDAMPDEAQPTLYALTCPPPTEREYRIVIQVRNPDGELHTRCFIEPINVQEPPSRTIRRLLEIERIES